MEIERWNNDEILNENYLLESEEGESANDETVVSEVEPKISHTAAISSTMDLLKWCRRNEQGAHYAATLQNMRDDIMKTMLEQSQKPMKQSTLSSFFTKRNV